MVKRSVTHGFPDRFGVRDCFSGDLAPAWVRYAAWDRVAKSLTGRGQDVGWAVLQPRYARYAPTRLTGCAEIHEQRFGRPGTIPRWRRLH